MDSVVCIFNPEHDLCLGNGSSNYMPPASALRFAESGAGIMRILYPEAVQCLPSPLAQASTLHINNSTIQHLIPWGWNIVLRNQLLKLGVAEDLLPSAAHLATIRQLQHRSTILSLQPQSIAATKPEEVEAMVAQHHAVVMKAPWSGSGRGLRWVSGGLIPHDLSWMLKVVKNQGCVIVEPRRKVLHDFAVEYYAMDGQLRFEGYSLFESANGVYQHNLLLTDEAIAAKVGYSMGERARLEAWLMEHIVPMYHGPLGVDILHTEQGCFISEINLRHTMGLVACRYRQQHPEQMGEVWRVSDCQPIG